MKELESCPECGMQESYPPMHKMGCGSKSVFDSYVVLRDWDLKVLTDEQIARLGFKFFVETAERNRIVEEDNVYSE
jgi:hypothetical protein